jgi:hypothetical protein
VCDGVVGMGEGEGTRATLWMLNELMFKVAIGATKSDNVNDARQRRGLCAKMMSCNYCSNSDRR